MTCLPHLPYPVLDALPLGAHRLSALTDEGLYESCGVRIAFTGRAGGTSEGPYASLNTATHVGDDLACVQENRQIICESMGAKGVPVVVPNQVHGTRIVRVEDAVGAQQANERAAEGADGVAVDCAGVAVLMSFGDCLSLIVVSPTGRFVLAHAGWRGAIDGIAGKAVRALREHDEATPADFNAYLGPHIREECFEVGEELERRFLAEFGEEAVPSSRHVSMAAAVSIDLMRAGIVPERIADSGICTKCHPDQYYSYRAENGPCGRHASFAYRA